MLFWQVMVVLNFYAACIKYTHLVVHFLVHIWKGGDSCFTFSKCSLLLLLLSK